MPLTQFFRRLLLLYILFNVAEVIFADITVSWLPDALRKYEESRFTAAEADPELIFLSSLWLLTTVLFTISLVGLWKFWQPARWLFGTTLLLSILLAGLAGPFVSSALTFTVVYIESILSGLILALVYFSPIKDYFEKPAPSLPTSEPDSDSSGEE